MPLNKNKILQNLYDFNPWWKGAGPPEGELYHREPFETLTKLSLLPQMVALTGIRRVGKTTLLFQIIDHLIKQQTISPTRICRYQFEETLMPPNEEDIEEIIRTFLKVILQETLHTQEQTFFFFDEIQFVEGWQAILKKYYDLNKHIKFFLSGSASLFIRKTTRESLAGRIFEEKIHPLSFQEYLALSKNTQMEAHFDSPNFEMLDRHFIEKNKAAYVKNREIAPIIFEKFITMGQFPELVQFQEIPIAFRYIKNAILTKVIEYDLPKLFGFRKVGELAHLINVFARETGNLMEYKNMAQEIGLSQITLKDYVDAFIDSYLLHVLFNFTKKHREAHRQLKKSYIASPNLSCALLNLPPEKLTNNPFLGHLVETEIFNQLNKKFSGFFFWNDQGKEIDFVLPLGNSLIPIEVKYTNELQRKDMKAISDFLAKKNAPFAVIFTKNSLEQITLHDRPVYLIPAWMM